MEGKVYRIGEIEFPSPPLHTKCRCQIIPMEAIVAGNATKDGENGADFWLKHFDILPDYYITKEGLEKLGWKDGESPSKYAPGKMLAKVIYNNRNGHLPESPGMVWYEADINYTPGRRNSHRILWSNDGLIFVTYDHYQTFYEII